MLQILNNLPSRDSHKIIILLKRNVYLSNHNYAQVIVQSGEAYFPGMLSIFRSDHSKSLTPTGEIKLTTFMNQRELYKMRLTLCFR